MRAAVSGRKSLDRTKSNPREELRAYLSAPLEAVDNVLLWWGVSPRCIMVLLICLTHFSNMLCSIRRLPEWPMITLRYKALPPPLNVLSHKEGLTDTRRCNCLSPVVFEALQILKGTYRNGPIQAAEQAK